MSRLFASAAVVVATAGAVAAAASTPLDTVRALQKNFSAAYNTGDFTGLAGYYHPDADLVPPTADKFLKHGDVADFFRESAAAGLKNVDLDSLNVLVESSTLWHEIGNASHSLDPSGSLYYARWVNVNDSWVMAFDMMTIGDGFAKKTHASTSRDGGHGNKAPSKVVAALEGLWSALMQTGDYSGVRATCVRVRAHCPAVEVFWQRCNWQWSGGWVVLHHHRCLTKTTARDCVRALAEPAPLLHAGGGPVQPGRDAHSAGSLHRVRYPEQHGGSCRGGSSSVDRGGRHGRVEPAWSGSRRRMVVVAGAGTGAAAAAAAGAAAAGAAVVVVEGIVIPSAQRRRQNRFQLRNKLVFAGISNRHPATACCCCSRAPSPCLSREDLLRDGHVQPDDRPPRDDDHTAGSGHANTRTRCVHPLHVFPVVVVVVVVVVVEVLVVVVINTAPRTSAMNIRERRLGFDFVPSVRVRGVHRPHVHRHR